MHIITKAEPGGGERLLIIALDISVGVHAVAIKHQAAKGRGAVNGESVGLIESVAAGAIVGAHEAGEASPLAVNRLQPRRIGRRNMGRY